MNYYSSSMLTMKQAHHHPVLLEPFRLFEDDRTTIQSSSLPSTSESPSSSPSPLPTVYSSSNTSSGLTQLSPEEPNNDDDNEVVMLEDMMMIFSDDDDDQDDEDDDDDVLVGVEPTPIDRNSAIFVDKLPLKHTKILPLMSKQDAENYDFFIQTFSSSLVTTNPAVTDTMTGDENKEVIVPNAFNTYHVESSNTFVPSLFSFLQMNDNDTAYWMPLCAPTMTTWAATTTTTTPLVPVSRVIPSSHNGMTSTLTLPQQDQEELDPQLEEELDLELQDDDYLEYNLSDGDDDFSMKQETESPSSSLSSSSSSSSSFCCSASSSASASITASTTTTSWNGGGSTNSSGKDGSSAVVANGNNRTMHVELWNHRYQELIQFKQAFGHCLVPLNWPMNPPLGHWVKRQRYQYRIKHQQGRGCKEQQRQSQQRASTLTDARQAALEQLGFTWDSHASQWEERFGELCQFQDIHGHTNIPKKCKEFPQLPIWAKCQRRQYKLWKQGKKSHMTLQRLENLQSVGLCLDPLLLKKKITTTATTTATKKKH